eukprot:251955_1
MAPLTTILSFIFWSELSQAVDLDDIAHIVVFMQENRPFDHYFGTLQGVRGFNDRAAPLLAANGLSPFYQPYDTNGSYLLPFHLSFETTSATCMNAPLMDYYHDIQIWNNGRMDAWNTARDTGFGMSYFNRSDLPFYYALADSFLVGDNYFQSTFTATNPNRFYFFSGSNGLSVNSTFNILDDSVPQSGVNWTTMAEVLQNAGITWKVYQEHDNFDDNALEWFDNFKAAQPGSPLYDNGMARSDSLYDSFASDVRNGTLPQVSWIVGPAHLSEHATNHPQDGEDLSARLINIFGEEGNAEIWSKTVFILNYDEGGQFYDHLWVPTAPMNDADGKSTVTTEGEVTKRTNFHVPPGNPIGPGFRVPFFIVSPFTRSTGGIVYSELSDHTSVLQFIERRFNVTIPTISPWRRAVMSDLLHALDLDNPNYDFPVLPDTSNNTQQSSDQCHNNPKPTLPDVQYVPTQEVGTKKSRALPYSFQISDAVENDIINISMGNIGKAGVVFHVHDYWNVSNSPKKYTIESGKDLWDTWDLKNVSGYNLSLHGPNGFVRTFAGDNSANHYRIGMKEHKKEQSISFEIECVVDACHNDLLLENKVYGNETTRITILRQGIIEKNVVSSGNWYDYVLKEVGDGGNVLFERRFMGRVEINKDSITDPAMGVLSNNSGEPVAKFHFDVIVASAEKQQMEMCNADSFIKYGFIKDICWKKAKK